MVMRKCFVAMVLSLVCTLGGFAQNYSTVQITPQNGVLVVNGIQQISIPNYDPSEVQLEPMAGRVAVPSSDQSYTIAEFATLDAVYACFPNSSVIWSDNLVTLDTYSGQYNTGYAALFFSGSPNTYGYAKFDKSVSGGWIEFGYFTAGSGINELSNIISVCPNPVKDVLSIDNAEGAQISICNMNGQEMMHIEKAIVNEKVNVSDLSSGVYFVRIAYGNKLNTMKFVKE